MSACRSADRNLRSGIDLADIKYVLMTQVISIMRGAPAQAAVAERQIRDDTDRLGRGDRIGEAIGGDAGALDDDAAGCRGEGRRCHPRWRNSFGVLETPAIRSVRVLHLRRQGRRRHYRHHRGGLGLNASRIQNR